MSTPSGTWNSDTVTLPALSSPARSRFDRDSLWRPGPDGPIFTGDCIADEPETTDIPTDECQYEFIVRLEDRHPRAIVCTTHGWTGVIYDDGG